MWRDRIKEARDDAWESTILNRGDGSFKDYCQLHCILYGTHEYIMATLKFFPGQPDEQYNRLVLNRKRNRWGR